MLFIYYLFALIFCTGSLFGTNRIDEEIAQDFVLQTRQIHIPHFRGSFNPSVIKWGDGWLMSFRIRNVYLTSTFEVGLVWLDAEFNPCSMPQILHIPLKSINQPKKVQDPRLVSAGNQLYIVYSNEIKERLGFGDYETRRVFVSKLRQNGTFFDAEEPECLHNFEGERLERWEKNWVPFDYQGRLFLAYSLIPHRILHPLLDSSGICETAASSSNQIYWPWGPLRGGTPAVKINDKYYLSFFHSSIPMATPHSDGKTVLHYFMGAYLFECSPPFRITHMSSEPIIGKNFYKGVSYKTFKPVRVVFPGGLIVDRDFIWVFYGRQDHEIWVVKLDKQGLLKSLIPVP